MPRPSTSFLTPFLVLLALAAAPESRAQSVPSAAGETVAELHALFEDYWARHLRESPVAASFQGDLRYNDRWPDLSEEALEARHRSDLDDLERLAAIPRARLPESERVNYDLFERELGNRIDIHRYGRAPLYQNEDDSAPLNQREGIHASYAVAERLPFATEKHYRDWIARLESFGTYMDQSIRLVELALENQLAQPEIIVARIRDQVETLLTDDAVESPFYAPFRRIPEGFPPALARELSARGAEAVSSVVIPAFRRYLGFIEETWLPAARETYGVLYEPRGEAWYANRIAYFTTTALSAEEIHAIGLGEVARIRREMDALIESTGFNGGFEDFLAFLRTDPRFYYDDPQALLEAYLATSKRADPGLTKLFGRLPRTPYGVRPIPAALAPHTTTAYYSAPAEDGSRPGWYYVNLYKPESRPKYEIEVLTVHEAVPGHHLENALTMELEGLPTFRREAYLTAYSEGWALYAESLGGDLGLYRDPYSKFGQLTYEMWRAVRLVVDTGLHAMGWDRSQAIEYFKANAAKTELDIVNEVDRYIAWPGQALAYKIGELEIKKLRAEAEAALGEDFDIRAFHDQILAAGPVTLQTLADNTRAWIAAQRAN